MGTRALTPLDEAVWVEAASGGDEQAFERLLEPHRRAIRAHCYRLLGSLEDADDAVQETSLRAWKALDRFEPRAPFRAWVYRIATNVCLRAIERRARAPEALDPGEIAIARYFQPYPDRLMSADATVEERESLGLAFVSVVQLLPPRQRAVLVLRDVLDWSAQEVADLLGDSVASVNSARSSARERNSSASGPRADSLGSTRPRRPRPRRESCSGSSQRGRRSTWTGSSRSSPTTLS